MAEIKVTKGKPVQESEDENRKEDIEHAKKYGREIDVWEAKNVE